MKKLFRLAAPAAATLSLLAGTAPPAAAAPAVAINAPGFVHPARPQADARAAERRAKAKAARQRAGAQMAADETPPVLTAFQIESHVNTRKQGEQAVVSFAAEDDLSGFYDIRVDLRGPSGQTVSSWSGWNNYHDTRWDGQLTDLMEAGGAYEPGEWVVERAQVSDWYGNSATYDTAALAALGNTTLMVKNRVYDRTAPALVTGDILTPTLSVSKKRAGLPDEFGDDAKLRLTVADGAFGPITSGIGSISVRLCRWVGKTCVNHITATAHPYIWGVTEQAFTMGVAIGNSQPTGLYVLDTVSVSDNAGNSITYTDKNRDGADFAAFFPGGVSIDVQP